MRRDMEALIARHLTGGSVRNGQLIASATTLVLFQIAGKAPIFRRNIKLTVTRHVGRIAIGRIIVGHI